MISYHKNKSWNDKAYGKDFLTVDTTSLIRVANGISEYAWSSIVWNGGVRKQIHFIHADFAVLDFDSGETTLEDAKIKFCDVNYIIGPTRSHTPEHHRFRVVLPLERRITDIREYRFNIQKLCHFYGTDKTCRDGARFFYPCKSIEAIHTDGDNYPVLPTPSDFENPDVHEPREELTKLMWARYKKLPPWTDKFLKRGKPFEGKHRQSSAFMVACQMKVAGLTPDEAYSLLLKAPIDRTNFAENELKHAVESAYKK